MLVQLLVAGRRLQLAQAANLPDQPYRPPIVAAAKNLINSYVQLGAAQLLRHCDMRESASHQSRSVQLSPTISS
jgi:hypothetical protein